MKNKIKYFVLSSVLLMATILLGNITVWAETEKEEIPYVEYDFITKEEISGIYTAEDMSSDLYYNMSEGFEGTLPYDEQSIIPNSVTPPDDRFLVTNTSKLPFRWIGYITCTWSNGMVTHGTGWLFGESVVLTAAHVIYGQYGMNYPVSVEYTPGYDKDTMPYQTYTATKMRVTQQFSGSANLDGDVGVLKLPSPIGRQLGYFAIECKDDVKAYNNKTIGITGYPSDKPGKMYSTSGRLYAATERRFHYDLDTFLGQDGAPIFYKDPNNANRRICIGIHTTEGSPLNSGVRFFRILYNWIKSTEQSFS